MVTKTKILFILHAVGGVGVWLRIILPQLNPELFDFVIIHGKTDTNTAFTDKNGNLVKTYTTTIDRNINVSKDYKAIKDCMAFIDKESPDIIHCHSSKAGVIGKIAGAIKKKPVFYTPHAYSFLSSESVLKQKIYLGIEQVLSRFNNKVLACSVSEKNRAIKDVGHKKKKVLVFENGIKPIPKITPLRIEKTWPDRYICSVARPSFQKNVELTIEVIRQVQEKIPAIHIVIMGVGFHSPNLEKVTNLIKLYGLEENVTLLPWTEREDIFHIINKASLYISTARYEGLPYAVIEAMALKKSFVVTDADGNRDLIEDGENGYLVKDENSAAFATKIIALIQHNDKRVLFENKSIEKFNARFNIENTIPLLEQIYLKEALN